VGDLDEYAACQAALVPLHAARRSARAAEFGAYRLLHAATARGEALGAELCPILSSLRPDDARSAAVRQALRVAVALAAEDLRPLFAELRAGLHHRGGRLLDPKLPPLRERALRVLCSAFAPSIPLPTVARALGWRDGGGERGGEGEGAAAGPARCAAWLRSLGVVPVPTAQSCGSLQVMCKPALRTLAARCEALQRDEEEGPAPR